MAAERRCWAEDLHEFEHVRSRVGKPAFDEGAEVLHVGNFDDGGLWIPVEIAAPGEQGVVHHLDDDAVLNLVFSGGYEGCGETLVHGGVADAWSGPCERVRSDGVTGARDEQFW